MEKRATLALVIEAPRVISGHLVGSIIGESVDGPLVDYPANPHGPLLARSTVQLSTQLTESIVGLDVLLVFEGERSDKPIVVGVLRDRATREQALADAPADKEPLEALVDGKRVVIDASDEIVLRCGKASITLRRNGRVVIRGTYVETRAEGVNRVKGGSVQIN
jgi:hypothetical protein